MRNWIQIVEGFHGGYEDEDDFDISILGPTGAHEVWHATNQLITHFNPFTHFGSREAAMHRARDLNLKNGYLYRVHLNVSKSCWINDSGQDQHPVNGIIEYLETILDLPFDEVSGVGNDPVAASKLLGVYGYDTLVYHNGWEDKGSVSWVGLVPDRMVIQDYERIP